VVEVDAVAIARRGDAGIDDVESELIEHGRGACKSVLAVRRKRHDRRRTALALGLHRHHRVVAPRLARREHAGVPGDLLRGVPQEVRVREHRPDAVHGRVRDARCGEQLSCLRLMFLLEFVLVDRRLEAAAQRTLHPVVEFTEERGLPGVPEAWVRRAHIGGSEYVEVIEVGLIAYEAREFIDDGGVGDVLLLCRERELQVITHEPGDEAGVVAREALLEAEGFGIDGAELGVIATATFCDVVKKRREIRDLGPRERLHDLRDIRQLMIESRQCETA
jgi:hypothetical protein